MYDTNPQPEKRFPKPGILSGIPKPNPERVIPIFVGEPIAKRSGLDSAPLSPEQNGPNDFERAMKNGKMERYLREAMEGYIYPSASEIDWLQTASDILNGRYFLVERSSDGEAFAYSLVLDRIYNSALSEEELQQRQNDLIERYENIIRASLSEDANGNQSLWSTAKVRSHVVNLVQGLISRSKATVDNKRGGYMVMHLSNRTRPSVSKSGEKEYAAARIEKIKQDLGIDMSDQIYPALQRYGTNPEVKDFIVSGLSFLKVSDTRALAMMEAYMNSSTSNPHGRVMAAIALAPTGNRDAFKVLEGTNPNDLGYYDPSDFTDALRLVGGEQAYDKLKSIMESSDSSGDYKRGAALALGQLGFSDGKKWLHKSLLNSLNHSGSPDCDAAAALVRLGSKELVDLLAPLMVHECKEELPLDSMINDSIPIAVDVGMEMFREGRADYFVARALAKGGYLGK